MSLRYWPRYARAARKDSAAALGGLMNLGGIAGDVLQRMGASLPLPYDLAEPWRFVTAVFLHGSLMHIAFNMWVLMDIGPQVEEMYGTGRYLFLYVVTGIGGYVLSSAFGNFSVGGSGALLGLVGVMLAITVGRKTAGMMMLRSQLIRWLVYIAILGFVVRGVDNYAHFGGLATGFLLGRIMVDRPPADTSERTANAMGGRPRLSCWQLRDGCARSFSRRVRARATRNLNQRTCHLSNTVWGLHSRQGPSHVLFCGFVAGRLRLFQLFPERIYYNHAHSRFADSVRSFSAVSILNVFLSTNSNESPSHT